MSMMLNMVDVTETPRVADQIGYKDGKTVADKLDELTSYLQYNETEDSFGFYHNGEWVEVLGGILTPVALVPNMTSDTMPSGQVIMSSYYSNEYSGYKAFDGSLSDGWGPARTDSWGGAYIGYIFDEAKVVDKFTAYVRYVASTITDQRDYIKLQASKDGSAWNDLTENVLVNGFNIAHTFDVTKNKGSYRYYKVVLVSSPAGHAIDVGHGWNFQFYGKK